MSKPKHTAKLVVTSIITSIIVVVVIALVFIKYIVPVYNISEDDIYSVLIKLFPLIIGFVLIQIGVMAGKKNEDSYKDQVDKLPSNAYSDPLMRSVNDDPNALTYGEKALPPRPEVIEKTVEIEKPVQSEVIKEVIRPTVVEHTKEVCVPVKEVICEDSEISVIKTEPGPEVIKEVIKEVVVYVDREVPAEPQIVEKTVEVDKETTAEEKELSFEDILDIEIDSAEREEYDLSLLYLFGDDSLDVESIKTRLDEDYVFSYKLGYVIILPFYGKTEAEKVKTSAMELFCDANVNLITRQDEKDAQELVRKIS